MDLFSSQKKDKLKESVKKILDKYDDRVPIFVFKSRRDNALNNIDKNKYIVPTNLTAGDLLNIIRKKLDINQEVSICLFINDKIMVSNSEKIGVLYEEYKNEDNLLNIYYCGENSFGN
jgi:GABA(A) receptor-associated protein